MQKDTTQEACPSVGGAKQFAEGSQVITLYTYLAKQLSCTTSCILVSVINYIMKYVPTYKLADSGNHFQLPEKLHMHQTYHNGICFKQKAIFPKMNLF
jgi:hypothetical protein